MTANTTAASGTIVVSSNANIPIGSTIQIVGATFGTDALSYATVVNLTGSTGVELNEVVNQTLSGAAVSWNDAEYKQIHGMVYDKSVAAVSTSGTGEDNLRSTVIPAGMMTTSSGFEIFAAGTKSGSGGNKTIKFYFGATSITFHAAANNTNGWRFSARIYNLEATNSQGISWVGWDGATMLQGYDTAAIDTTAAVTVKITGECADGGDTVTQALWSVEPK